MQRAAPWLLSWRIYIFDVSSEGQRVAGLLWAHTVPDGDPRYQHDMEGPDDMPAHIKASMLDTSLSIPIQDGRLAFGTWQGIYLNEHRDNGGARSLLLTIQGESA